MADLRGSFERLDEEQRAAVLHEGSAVLLAGPGSGKTATLVMKVAHLMSSVVTPPRGVACLTYNRDTVREFSSRLRGFGMRPSRRLFLGTVHSFCLNRILRPFSSLAGRPELASRTILNEARVRSVLQHALDFEAVAENPAYFGSRLQQIRRALACQESVESFDPRHVLVAERFEELLQEERLLDFEGMVLEALAIIRSDEVIRDLLVSRFPWLAVDEYQDLGGPLHLMVLALHDAGASVFAVGDSDQSIYAFQGARPEYLDELSRVPGFRTFRLRFNYRAGARLIAASEAALPPGEERGYQADPKREDKGEIYIMSVPPTLENHAATVAREILPQLHDLGIANEEIAVLYPRRGRLLDVLIEELRSSGIEFVAERDERFPGGPLVHWLQRCANWALDPGGYDADRFVDLSGYLAEIYSNAGRSDPDTGDLDAQRALYQAVGEQVPPGMPLLEWLTGVEAKLRLRKALEASQVRPDDVESLDALVAKLTSQPEGANYIVSDFPNSVRVRGRVTVTTYHSSKGRQFDAVVLPGLQETLMPAAMWNRASRQYEISDAALLEQRRLFYVGLTRARRFVFLVCSTEFRNDYGYTVPGRSRFVDEIERRLAEPV